MATVLGVNAAFHDPAAALVVDGRVVAAAEEERFGRRRHGRSPVPFAPGELPEQAIRFCLEEGGVEAGQLDAVAYSYDPALADPAMTGDGGKDLPTTRARRAPRLLPTVLPGLDPARVRHVAHHQAHAASAWAASPHERSAVLVLDGRGERSAYLAGRADGPRFESLATCDLPASLGLRYEELTAHLGYRRSSDGYEVMAMASYGQPTSLADFRQLMRAGEDGTFVTEPVDWCRFAPPGTGDGTLTEAHANLAATVQCRLEEVELDLARWLHRVTGERALTMAGGVALNCTANSRLHEHGPFDDVWVQPAAGDAGTALGAALAVAANLGDEPEPVRSMALGRSWTDDELARHLDRAAVAYERPPDIAEAVARVLADDGLVAWFQGRSEFGPRALGHRSLLAHPGAAFNTERLNDVTGREQFRPVAPMVLAERAAELFGGGPLPSPHMLFTHRVRAGWAERIPAAVHVDGTARVQTVDRADEPLVHRMLTAFERRTGLPAVINTAFCTAGRARVDSPVDALECFDSSPIDALALGPYLIRRRRT